MKKYLIVLITSVLFLVSCGEYQRLLKSDDAELKYNKAVEYFNKKDYMRASTLFDAVSGYYKGTDRSETVLNYLARSYMGQEDYQTAVDYYKSYAKSYPKGQYIIEAKFMIGYCAYKESPDPRLDQTETRTAIAAFQDFIDSYPESERIQEANKLLEELTNKLAYKDYLNSKLYFNLGNYMGNNYESCIITAQNALKHYPSNKYREEFLYLILQSKYQEAIMSVSAKRDERYRNTIDEYYNYLNEFPNGKYKKQVEKIFSHCKKEVK